MSNLQATINILAELEACERIWSFADAKLDAELKRRGVDPDGLLQRLGGALGSREQTEAGANGPASAAVVALSAMSQSPAAPVSGAGMSSVGLAAPMLEVAGKLKFFDAIKGYGFFAADEEKGDVLVHISHLHAAGYRTVYEGARIHALVQLTSKGLQVARILSIDETCAVHPSQIPQRTREKVQVESAWVPALVKWYNPTQGYGFVAEQEDAPDCFVHADVLRRWGMPPLWAGQVVEIRWGNGSKGRMVAEIRHPGAISGLPPMH